MTIDYNTQIDNLVREFAGFLDESWDRISRLAKDTQTGSYIQDWCQANWETIVEGALEPPGIVYLECYGEGADCNGASSRVYLPKQSATHSVHCVSYERDSAVHDLISDKHISLGKQGLPLEELASQSDTWFERKPPFDCVLVIDQGTEILLRIKSVRFILVPKTRP